MDGQLKRTRTEVFLLFVLYLFILPRNSMELDMGYWREWGLAIHRVGLAHTYDTTVNYFPVYVYGLWLYDLLQGSVVNIAANISSIKILFVSFDFLPVLVLCCFRKRILKQPIPHFYLLLNIAYVFNSMVWGQIDSIYTNLAFLGIVIGVANPVAGSVLFLLALNTKAQAIVFFPVMVGILWHSVRDIKTLVYIAGALLITELALLAPFISAGGVGKLWQHALSSVDLYTNLSISAFNFWYLVTKENPFTTNSLDTFIVFSYKTWGLILFGITAVGIVTTLLKTCITTRRAHIEPPSDLFWQQIFLGTGMLCLCFFYFNSQMHERYVHPVIIFFFFYGVVSKNYKLYILASIPYVLSLDKCFSYPNGYLPIYHFKIIYASKILALWYTSALLYGGWLYYQLIQSKKTGIAAVVKS